MDTEQWLAQYRNRIDGMKQAAADLSEGLAAATVTTSSADESVTVTIGPNGGLRDLRFSHRAAEHTHAELAALVLQTVAKGQRAVAEKVVETFAPVGDTNTMDLLTSFVPEEGTEEAAAPSNAYDELAADTPPAPQPPAPVPTVTPPAAPAPARARTRPARSATEDGDDFEERPW